MSPRLSIVIPFYNVEKYIAECLDSVYNQDIPEEEYEVICVNDASPDGSRDIVLEYQKKHTNLILVEHEVNRKLGAARNTGRRIARGKYLWNVDSDDMIAPNCLSKILDKCEKNDLDVLLFGFSRRLGNINESRGINPWKNTDYVFNGLSFWREQVLNNMGEISPVWTQVYSRDFLDGNDIWSPEINMGEDVPFTYKSILFAGRMMCCNDPYYVYRRNQASLSASVRKMPTPPTLYENCFICGRMVYGVIASIPPPEKEVRESLLKASRYILLEFHQYYPRFTRNEKRQFLHLCRIDALQNMETFSILSRKQRIKHLRFLIIGR